MGNETDALQEHCEYVAQRMRELRTSGVIYLAVIFPYLIITVITRVLALIAFYFQAKKQSAYRYQIFLTVAELIEAITLTGSKFSRGYLSTTEAYYQGGVGWFKRCAACMYYNTFVAQPLQLCAYAWTLQLMICMTLDRIYALAKPLKYGRLSERRGLQYGILGGTFLIAAAFSIGLGFLFKIIYNTRSKEYIERENTDISWLTYHFIYANSFLRFICFALIMSLNTVLFRLFTKRMKHKITLFREGTNQTERDEIVNNVKTLFRLTIIQSVVMVISVSADTFYNMVVYLQWYYQWDKYHYLNCLVQASTPFADLFREIGGMPTFFIMLAFSPGFRKSVVSGLKDVKEKFNNNRVRNIGVRR